MKRFFKENWLVIVTGIVVGAAALLLQALGNPKNMGFCIACFERDIVGAVGLHSAEVVQYVRPEIIGIVLGSCIMALIGKEFRAQAGSAPATRFAVGALADMIGGILAGYAINPLITLGAASIGLVGGWLWQTLPHTLRLGQRLLLSVVAAHVVGSIVINSLALHIFYGYAWSVLAARVPNALILTAVNTVLLRLLMENKAVMAAVKK